MKFHFNQETGKTGTCAAENGKCPLGGDESQHFSTESEAKAFGEKTMNAKHGVYTSLQKTSVKEGIMEGESKPEVGETYNVVTTVKLDRNSPATKLYFSSKDIDEARKQARQGHYEVMKDNPNAVNLGYTFKKETRTSELVENVENLSEEEGVRYEIHTTRFRNGEPREKAINNRVLNVSEVKNSFRREEESKRYEWTTENSKPYNPETKTGAVTRVWKIYTKQETMNNPQIKSK